MSSMRTNLRRGAGLVAAATSAFSIACQSDQLTARTLGTLQAFAGGATIAVLADSLMPEAFKEGGWWVGIATATGFLVAFLLGG